MNQNIENYKELVHILPDIVYKIDTNGYFTYLNESVQKIGYNSDQLIGKHFSEIIHTDDVKRVQRSSVLPKYTGRATKEGGGAPPLLFDERRTGSRITKNLSIRLIKKNNGCAFAEGEVIALGEYDFENDEKKDFIGTVGYIKDVTGTKCKNKTLLSEKFKEFQRRKRADEVLSEEEDKFSSAFQSSLIPTSINTLMEGRYIDVNESAVKQIGYNREELIGNTVLGLNIFSDQNDHFKFMSILLEDGEVDNFECNFKSKSGEIHSAISSAKMIMIKGEDCVVTSSMDITKLKRAENALIECNERYRQLVENASDIVYRIDKSGHLVSANPVAIKIMGYHESELIGKNYLDLIHSDYRNDVKSFYSLQFENKTPNTYHEFPAVTSNGKALWLGHNVHLEMDDNKFAGFHVIANELARKKQIDNTVKSTVDNLRKAMNGIIQAIELTVEARDLYTAGHQRRVSNIARAIANEMGLPKNKLDGIRIAGLLHDLGKMNVPAEILSKPGKITDVEFTFIKSHSRVGYDILKNIEFPWPIDHIVLQHHERIDGSGYPEGLSGEDILIEAKIIAVADVVEAMSSHRPYRAALGIDAALEEVEKNKGIKYDPDVVDACIRIFKEKGFSLDKNFDVEKIIIVEEDTALPKTE